MRILLLLILGLLLYLVFINLFRKRPSTDLPAETEAERMVRCEHCGLHLPEREAIAQDKHYFCSTEHLELKRKSR